MADDDRWRRQFAQRALADAQEAHRRAREVRMRLQEQAFRAWLMNFVNRCWAARVDPDAKRG